MSFTSGSSSPAHGRRDVGIMAVTTGISYCGDFLAATALTLTLQAHGAGGFAIAALLLATTVPPILMAPLAGRLVDRYSSRILLLVVGPLQVAVCAGLAFATRPALVIALMAVLAAGLAVTGPTLQALLPDLVDADDLPTATATVQTVRGVGMLLGPVLGGLLVGAFGPRLPLLLDAASYLAIVAAALLVRTVRRAAVRHTPAEVGTGPRGGFAVVRGDRLLLGYLVMLTVGVAALTADNVSAVFLIRGELHGTTTMYGAAEAVWTVAMLAGGWALGRRMPGDRRLVRMAVVQIGVVALVEAGLAAVPGVAWLVPLYLVGGVANGFLNLSTGVLLGRRVPAAFRGRVGALFGAVVNSGVVAGYLLGGALLAVLPVRQVYLVAGGLALLAVAVLGVPVVRAARPVPATAPAPATQPASA
jgi:MFS family permease